MSECAKISFVYPYDSHKDNGRNSRPFVSLLPLGLKGLKQGLLYFDDSTRKSFSSFPSNSFASAFIKILNARPSHDSTSKFYQNSSHLYTTRRSIHFVN